MKSYVDYLKGLYSAMFVDIAEHFPSLRRDCERDASRLLSLVDSRGLPFLMVDLPEVGKAFDRALSDQRLDPLNRPGFGVYKRGTAIPRLFKGLWLRVFNEKGLLRADVDVAFVRYLRQLLYAAKKVKVSCSDSRTWEHVHEFFTTDQEVRLPSLKWDEDDLQSSSVADLHLGDHRFASAGPDLPLLNEIIDNGGSGSLSIPGYDTLDAVQRTADIVSATLGGFEPAEWRAKHGPGAVADQRHTQFKYDFPNWPAKLQRVFPLDLFGFSNYAIWADFVGSKAYHELFSLHEPPSRLIAVPKTLKGPRLIASEPVSHQWCQQTLLDFFTARLHNTPISQSIHFRDQSENGRLALSASHTQSHVTIDLSSASDRLSCWLVERIFRRNLSTLEALHASRTRWVANAIDRKSPQFHKLRKFACMGSACTFPVQSIVFTILAIGSILSVRKLPVTISSIRKISSEVRVFGDDIVVPSDSWEVLQGVLSHLGLKVNLTKTYVKGRFRESCGVDAYNGNDVTPTYSKAYPDVSRPDSITSCIQTHNNLISSGYYAAAAFVRTRVSSIKQLLIPRVPLGSGMFGFYDAYAEGNSHLKRRWNPTLQRIEFRASIPYGRTVRRIPNSNSLLLQFFTVSQGASSFLLGDRLGVAQRAKTSYRNRWVSVV